MNITEFVKNKEAVIFSDLQRGSFKIIGALYKRSLQSAGFRVKEFQTPSTKQEREKIAPFCRGKIVFHNTIGFNFITIPNAYNIALPVHEWSQYPEEWVGSLNLFEEVWVTTDYVESLLRGSGVNRPIFNLPPSLCSYLPTQKKQWDTKKPFKFLAIGEAHFRKGFHLLMLGFMKAFPEPFEVTLTIKTSESCSWVSPRKDIIIVNDFLKYEQVLEFYSQFDCYVSASLGEGLGLPIAEAILSFLPVATNYWGGHKSLLTDGGFFKIDHEIIDQPFCSNPSYYAESQKCALSRPDSIAKTLRTVFGVSAKKRETIAKTAREHLLSQYGEDITRKKIYERLK